MSRAGHHSIAKPPIAKLSIASCPSQHRRAVHRSIAKPFFVSCPSRAVHRCIVKLSSSITSCPSLYCRAVQRFIAEPSIDKPSIAEPSIAPSCPSRAVHRSIAKPFLASCPSRAIHCCIVKLSLSIASCPSQHRQAIYCDITEPSSALSPSHPLPSRPLCQAVHRTKLSITTSSSRPLLHRQAVFRELSITSRPSLHRQAVIVHHELSIALLPSRPALYRRAVHRQAVHCRAVHCAELSIASRPSLHRQAVFGELSIASHPLLHRQAVIVHHELSIALSPSRPALYC